jgi:hypothetical protein
MAERGGGRSEREREEDAELLDTSAREILRVKVVEFPFRFRASGFGLGFRV